MALTGLDIYKLLPKTNCKDCGFATCLAFAMALAQKKASLDKCPHVTIEAKRVLESASQPPIKLVTMGVGDKKLEMGNETVMYRHEQKFYHPAGIGLLVEDALTENDIADKIKKINGLTFERVGQIIAPELICLKNSSGNKDLFVKLVSKTVSGSKLNIALQSQNIEALKEALKISKDRRPLIIWDGSNLDEIVKLAKEYKAPLAVTCASPEEAAELTKRIKQAGVEEIVISIKGKGISGKIQDFTFIRRTALKKNERSLGYPLLAFTSAVEPYAELAEAVSYVLKYASLVIVKNIDKDFILPLLVARQDLYSDPQKPVQVEPKVYEIGKVGKNSPVIITTNFSITYFTVAGEVEASKVPTYIVCCDAEGMSVLTAWAAEKFTPESIDATIKSLGLDKMVGHKRLVIPGYVSVMSGKLEELTGWKISVGPREASGIPNYLRNYK
ncbi:MAG: acetyl-CoA decarbonylase/synthase complex subunit gamma [Candidatus Omnitrophica bacterium]|nr:acetyl-CoA decarbonylase/synthase complex subunit gamma [Candidatus Omnitrophota bacterium]